jgi:uncharacterized protein (DUF433 family)
MTKTHIDYTYALKECQEISVNPEIMGGVPCIKGTRIPVHCILGSLYEKSDLKGVVRDYPQLSLGQIMQSIYFAQLVLAEATGD